MSIDRMQPSALIRLGIIPVKPNYLARQQMSALHFGSFTESGPASLVLDYSAIQFLKISSQCSSSS